MHALSRPVHVLHRVGVSLSRLPASVAEHLSMDRARNPPTLRTTPDHDVKHSGSQILTASKSAVSPRDETRSSHDTTLRILNGITA